MRTGHGGQVHTGPKKLPKYWTGWWWIYSLQNNSAVSQIIASGANPKIMITGGKNIVCMCTVCLWVWTLLWLSLFVQSLILCDKNVYIVILKTGGTIFDFHAVSYHLYFTFGQICQLCLLDNVLILFIEVWLQIRCLKMNVFKHWFMQY